MATRCTVIEDRIYDYIVQATVREPDILRRLREETAALPEAECQISAEQGQFMALLVHLMGAGAALEVGTFTGYSSTVVAMALRADGHMTCCDVSERWTAVARRYWQEAGVADRIELLIGPASETLDALLERGRGASYDFAFIDADKQGYPAYYEQCLRLVRAGGVILFDNMLNHGRVADPGNGRSTTTIRDLNAFIGDDDRVRASLLPIGDGLLIALKR